MEEKEQTMSTAAFVEQLFQQFLGRPSDALGRAYWESQLDNQSLTASEVTELFISSPEFSQTVSPIAQLYYAALGRIPDAAGLQYWVNAYQNGASLTSISKSFIQSAEFQSNFSATTDNNGFLDLLYKHVFNRSPDDAGKEYWLSAMAEGMIQAEVLVGFAQSAEFTATKSADIQVLLKYHGILGTQPSQAEIDAAIAANEPEQLITQLYTAAGYTGEPVPYLTDEGVVIDGYVSGATVFIDSNGDGVLNAGEASTTTDAFGNFDFGADADFGPLVMIGGRDISTGQAFEGTMTAPSGSSVVNPLTTLITHLTNNSTETATTIEQATALMLQSLGLDPTIDLLNYDPIAEASRTDTSATATQTALAVQVAAVQVNTLLSQTAALLTGVGVGDTDAATLGAAYAALAESIETSGGSIDLSAPGVIASVIADAASQAGATSAQQDSLTALSADASQTIANFRHPDLEY